MLTNQTGVWYHLRGETFSCLLCINCYGKVELTHLGAPVELADGQALRLRPDVGWNAGLTMGDGDNGSALEALPLLWSDAGRGDHRDCPISLSRGGRALATDFCFAGGEVRPEPPETVLPCGRGGEALLLRLRDGEQKLALTLELRVYPTALGLRTILHNEGERPILLHRLWSACVDIFGRFTVESYHGGWAAEMQPCRTPVDEAGVVLESRCGSSSNQHQPGFLLCDPAADEERGRVYACNLLWSGNHRSSMQRSQQGLTRLGLGVSPLHWARELPGGEAFETPQAVIAYSGGGKNGASQAMHRFVRDSVIPPIWRERPRPVVYNSWEGCAFAFTEERLLRLAEQAAALGCETFVLDDGWFGCRDDDSSSLGDYTEHPQKLPHGLGWLGERLRALGLDFGLWFEPEAVSPNSELFRAHPDWAIREREQPILGRHELLLDLSKPEVRDYLAEQVGGVIDRAGLRFVKWDMNRHSTALGDWSYDHILGLYALLHRIFDPRPQVLLEMCSSGGNRFDLGMLFFAPQIWCSDNTDPVCRLTIQDSLSRLYPQSCLSCHVSASPNAQTLRRTPLETRGNVAMFGIFGLELDLAELTEDENAILRAQIRYYKQHRPLFQFGRFTRLPAEAGATCWQTGDESGSMVGLFHRLSPPAAPYERLCVGGLAPSVRYRVSARPQLLQRGELGDLAGQADALLGEWLSAIPEQPLTLSASGAALESGIALNQRFTGTGYHGEGRMHGDFGSNIYGIFPAAED